MDAEAAQARPTAWRVSALARDWGLSDRRIYRLIADGHLRSVRVGRYLLVPDDEVRRFLATGTA